MSWVFPILEPRCIFASQGFSVHFAPHSEVNRKHLAIVKMATVRSLQVESDREHISQVGWKTACTGISSQV